MATEWLEPITVEPIIDPEPIEHFSNPNIKIFREHKTDVVIIGDQDGPWFYPRCRRHRHFVDGELVEYYDVPVKGVDAVPQERQSTPINL